MAKLPMSFFCYFSSKNLAGMDFFPALGSNVSLGRQASAFKFNGSAIIYYFQTPGRC